jgi:uncharacterized membrane protein
MKDSTKDTAKDTAKDADERVRAQFLDAVEREAAGLPADVRTELLADLAEHIDTALAERPGSIDQVVRELGDPRTIAASAATENASAVTENASGVKGSNGIAPTRVRRPRNPLTPLLILALSFPVATLNRMLLDHTFFALVWQVVGVVLLCRSAFWTGAQKTAGVIGVWALPATISYAARQSNSFDGMPVWLLNVLLIAMSLGSCVWLWSVRRRTA